MRVLRATRLAWRELHWRVRTGLLSLVGGVFVLAVGGWVGGAARLLVPLYLLVLVVGWMREGYRSAPAGSRLRRR